MDLAWLVAGLVALAVLLGCGGIPGACWARKQRSSRSTCANFQVGLFPVLSLLGRRCCTGGRAVLPCGCWDSTQCPAFGRRRMQRQPYCAQSGKRSIHLKRCKSVWASICSDHPKQANRGWDVACVSSRRLHAHVSADYFVSVRRCTSWHCFCWLPPRAPAPPVPGRPCLPRCVAAHVVAMRNNKLLHFVCLGHLFGCAFAVQQLPPALFSVESQNLLHPRTLLIEVAVHTTLCSSCANDARQRGTGW